MLFIADQHCLGDLEIFVMKFGEKDILRLSGDMSPSMPSHYYEKEDMSILKKFQSKFKIDNGKRVTEELPYNMKLVAHKAGIMSADENLFRELILFYGGASIFNLSRKHLINAYSKKGKTLCLAGNESTMDHAQRIIFKRIIKENNMEENKVIRYVWDNIKKYGEFERGLVTTVLDNLEFAGIKGSGEDFILKELSIANYNHIPTCLDVFRSYPPLENFEFIEDIYTEKYENCIIVHVPYFSEESKRYGVEAFAKYELKDILKDKVEGKAVINYHGNPCSEKMDNESVRDRTDYNIIVINAVVQSVREIIAEGKEIKMICSHLHKSNPDYLWNEERGGVRIYPLGVDDFAHLDTITGDIKVKKIV